MPPLPDVAQRVLQIVRDPNYSIDQLVAVVRTDPALTARILRLCNSSLFGLSREVTAVSDAVAYIGTRNLVRLTLVTCTAWFFQSARSSCFGTAADLWRHTLACASACQFLAETSGYDRPATAYTAGILHNVGKVALSQVLEPERLQVVAASTAGAGNHHDDWLERERAALGLDHATAGGIVTETWNLPADLRRAVRHHHDRNHLRPDGDLVALLHIADQAVLRMGIGVGFSDVEYRIDPAALNQLHLDAGALVALERHLAAELPRSEDFVNLEHFRGR